MSGTRKNRADAAPPGVGVDEGATLLAFLDYLRDSVARNAAGVGEPQVREWSTFWLYALVAAPGYTTATAPPSCFGAVRLGRGPLLQVLVEP